MVAATNRMNELISTLLNITRIESGTVAVTPKSTALDKLVQDLLPELELIAHRKSIKLGFKTVGKLNPVIKTDSLIVKEIITNLISNAIKYTPDEGTVSVSLKPRTDDVLFHVQDSGWGIPKMSQDQVFSKFFRAENIVKRETTGTGLGLYLVKGLLDELGGDIWFESKEGSGTNFLGTSDARVLRRCS